MWWRKIHSFLRKTLQRLSTVKSLFHETTHTQAHWALFFLLKNGYVRMDAYFEIEVQKLIKCLQTLKLRATIKLNHYPKDSIQANNTVGQYEFMLDHFVDDRVDGYLPTNKPKEEVTSKL